MFYDLLQKINNKEFLYFQINKNQKLIKRNIFIKNNRYTKWNNIFGKCMLNEYILFFGDQNKVLKKWIIEEENIIFIYIK